MSYPKGQFSSDDSFNALVPVIGLEIHGQIASCTKLFSRAPSAVFGLEANTCVSFVDGAFPGMLPVFNGTCVVQAVRLGLALGAQINQRSVMERKHYFYPDNPAGYQISQYDVPLVSGGSIEIQGPWGTKVIELERIHIEQDAGKTMHDFLPGASAIDLNRAGIGLMEIVSKPQLHSPDEVVSYVKAMRCLMRALGVCHGDMEKGQLRVDANISLHYPGEPLGTRIEIKNMNSLRFLNQALNYEIERQRECIRAGQMLRQETRLFDVTSGTTKVMRVKEDASDYFYFPDPDLPPLTISDKELEEISRSLPELPWQTRQRLVEDHGLSPYDAAVLTEDMDALIYFQETIKLLPKKEWHKVACNWVIGEVFGALKRMGLSICQCPVTPEKCGALILHMAEERLSQLMAKDVFMAMMETGDDADSIMEQKGLLQILNPEEIYCWIQEVVTENPKQWGQLLGGKEQLLGFFIGQVMKKSQGKAKPALVQELMKAVIKDWPLDSVEKKS